MTNQPPDGTSDEVPAPTTARRPGDVPLAHGDAAKPSWLERKRKEIFFEPDEQNAFPETMAELRAQVLTDDPQLAADILAEAEASHGRHKDRVEGAERRATTLQGSSAIAAGLTLTAAGLLVDPTKLLGLGWQLAFGVTVTYITFALAMCAWRATLASSKVHRWVTPADRDVLGRSGQALAEGRTERAASLLHSIGSNARFARYKVTMLRAAAEWIVRALFALLVLAMLSLAYALGGPEPNAGGQPAARPTETSSIGSAHPGPPAHRRRP